MGVSTNLVMTNENKDVFKIGSTITDSINNMLRKERRRANQHNPFAYNKDTFPCCEPKIDFAGRYVVFDFRYKGEGRRLWVFLDCDRDSHHMTDKRPNILLSLNQWGNYDEIVKEIHSSLLERYPKEDFFYDPNEGDSDV